MLTRYQQVLFFTLIFFLFFRIDTIPINSDDFWVFNIVHDMVEKPDYYSLSGSGYRIMHKLVYLPLFWLAGFDVDSTALPAALITASFSTLLCYLTFLFFSKTYSEESGLISAFLLGTSNAIYYTTWYWSSTHLIIGTTFFLAALYTYYFSKRPLLFWSILAGLSMFTRESFAILVFLSTILILWKEKTKQKWFTLIPIGLFGIYSILNNIFLGAFINPTFAGKINFSFANILKDGTYYRHLSQTLLLFFLLFCFALFTIHLFKTRKINTNHPLLITWFVGHLIVLLMTANADKRYLIPLLPLTFAWSAQQAQPYLQQKQLWYTLLGTLILWHLIFISKQALAIFSHITWTYVLHIMLLLLLIYTVSYFQKTIPTATSTIICTLLLLTALIQLTMTYSFYTYQYDMTTTPNAAIRWLAKIAEPTSIVLTNQPNSITTPDVNWFTSYGRKDITTRHLLDAKDVNGTLYLWSTPTSKIEEDTTGKLAQHQKLTPLKKFGEKNKKYPLLKISSSSKKRREQFLTTGTFFSIVDSPAYQVHLYKLQ